MGRPGRRGGIWYRTGKMLSQPVASVFGQGSVWTGGIFHVTVIFIYALSHIDLDHGRRNQILVRLIGVFASHIIG